MPDMMCATCRNWLWRLTLSQQAWVHQVACNRPGHAQDIAHARTCPVAILKPASMSGCRLCTSQSAPGAELAPESAQGSKWRGSSPTHAGMSRMHLRNPAHLLL